MTIEERVERLETFIGDIDRITSLYANSVQEICDKYLNLLYIETPSESNKNILIVDGFLAEIEEDKIPRNVMFNVRASHTFEYEGSVEASKIRFKRDNKYLDLPLKKYDTNNPGNLVFLEPGDYIQGIIYNVYVNSQGIAVISSSDTGIIALQEVAQLTNELTEVRHRLNEMSMAQDLATLKADIAQIGILDATNISLAREVTLPTGSSCSTPTSATHIANQAYVDSTIDRKIKEYFDSHILFGTEDPNIKLQGAEEKTVYFKY